MVRSVLDVLRIPWELTMSEPFVGRVVPVTDRYLRGNFFVTLCMYRATGIRYYRTLVDPCYYTAVHPVGTDTVY